MMEHQVPDKDHVDSSSPEECSDSAQKLHESQQRMRPSGSADVVLDPANLLKKGLARLGVVAHSNWILVGEFESDGKHYLLARANGLPSDPVCSLSKREQQVVSLATIGHSNKSIAYELGLAHSTVRVLMRRAAEKLGVSSRKELINLSPR